jgi:hypothetical protein
MSIIEYGGVRPVDRTRTLFAQVMGYVAATAGLFALGAHLGHNLAYGVAFVCYLLAFGCLIGMRFAVRRSAGLSVALLFGLGLLMGWRCRRRWSTTPARTRRRCGRAGRRGGDARRVADRCHRRHTAVA